MNSEHIGLWGIPSLYPTPKNVAEYMISKVPIFATDTILEPSAGKGDLAQIIRGKFPRNNLMVVEKDVLLRAILVLDGFPLVASDIFNFPEHEVFTPNVIIMNPPFSANYQDIDHVAHCWQLLPRGGRLVSLMHKFSAYSPSSNPFYKPNIFQEWMDRVGLQKELLPEGAFAEAEQPTNTEIALVWGTK